MIATQFPQSPLVGGNIVGGWDDIDESLSLTLPITLPILQWGKVVEIELEAVKKKKKKKKGKRRRRKKAKEEGERSRWRLREKNPCYLVPHYNHRKHNQ